MVKASPGPWAWRAQRQGVEGAAPPPPAVSLGDPRKACLCDRSTTGLWRPEEIQASAELA